MNKNKPVSFESKLTHYLGCMLFGTPKDLGMPEDFHYVPSERSMPATAKDENWRTLSDRIAINHFRRYLTVHVLERMKLIVVIGTVVVLLLTLGMGVGVGFVKQKWQARDSEQSQRNYN